MKINIHSIVEVNLHALCKFSMYFSLNFPLEVFNTTNVYKTKIIMNIQETTKRFEKIVF